MPTSPGRLLSLLPLVLTVTLALLSVSTPASAQSCEPFAGFPAFCVPYASPLVFVPAGLSQEVLGALVVNGTQPVVYAYAVCRESARRVACADAFRACNASVSAFPLSVCRSRCEEVNFACEPLLGTAALNCTEEDPALPFPAPHYPDPETCGCACNTAEGLPTTPYVVDCPGLLVFNEESVEDPTQLPCLPPCRLFLFSETQWERVDKSLLGLSVVSVVFALLAIGMFLVTGAFRRFPTSLIFHLILSSFFIALAFLIAGAHGNERTSCRTAVYGYKQNESGSAACVTSAFFLSLGSMGTLTFWLLMTVNLWVSAVLLKSLARYQYLLLALGWAWPLLGCVLTLSLSTMEYIPSSTYCFIGLAYNGALQWTFIYTLIIINLVLTPVLLGWVVFVLCRNKQLMTQTTREGIKKASQDPFVIRLMVVMFVLFLVFTFFLAFRIDVEVNDPTTAPTEYVQCALTSPQPDECERPTASFLLWLNSYLLVTVPMLVSILFGTSSVFYYWWVHRIENLRNGESFFARHSRTLARRSTMSGKNTRTQASASSAVSSNDA
jgi:Frizzled/Smoothened family membrane region